MKRYLFASLTFSMVIAVGNSAQGYPRRPNAAQVKKMQEEMQYRYQEMMRYQNEVAAKEREIYLSYDENGNGKLEAAEAAKFRKYMTAVQNGKEPNPFGSIVPPGKGPRGPGKK